MKKIKYLYIALICCIILAASYSWKGIMAAYRQSYCLDIQRIAYSTHTILNNSYEFSLPSDWNFTEEKLQGGEIEYNAYFSSKDKKINGLVQVWNINMPLADFLEQSKLSATGVVEFKFYKIEPTTTGTYRGYIVEYSRMGSDGKYHRAVEYYIPGKNKRYFRMSFFVDENIYTDKFKTLFQDIISRFKILK